MQSEESQKVVKRFFEAIYALKERKVIRGKQTFTRRYGINNRNFWLLEQDMSRDIFQMAWLSYLVSDYGVSPDWIITGKGDMFKKEPPLRLGHTNSKKK
ncbi:MAG: hypothetical protein LBO74_08745 [Candidatus Symbiothrix sp.]|jgi:hypothetical protein|nr:hypothetical protein [Candidatus Symbiothrix sp.]